MLASRAGLLDFKGISTGRAAAHPLLFPPRHASNLLSPAPVHALSPVYLADDRFVSWVRSFLPPNAEATTPAPHMPRRSADAINH